MTQTDKAIIVKTKQFLRTSDVTRILRSYDNYDILIFELIQSFLCFMAIQQNAGKKKKSLQYFKEHKKVRETKLNRFLCNEEALLVCCRP